MAIIRGSVAVAPRERPASVHEQTHITRDSMEADAHTAHIESFPVEWREPTNLQAPPPRPGMVQRWIRDLTVPNASDPNFARKFAEGWRVRSVETIPDSFRFLVGKTSGGSAALRQGNSILCEMPRALAEQRAKHYQDKLLNQMRSADSAETKQAAALGRNAKMADVETDVEHIHPRASKRAPVLTDS